MTPRKSSRLSSTASLPALLLLTSLLSLSGCSNGDAGATTQAVAKVGKQEVTELQVNQLLERQKDLKPDQVEPARRKAVASLVDQQILVDKAQQLKLDREQPVVQAIEAAKREIIARAYLQRVASAAPKPTAQAVANYYQDQPALFSERRIYSLQNFDVVATAAQRTELEAELKTLKSPAELDTYVKAHQLKVRSERSTVAAENIPLSLLAPISKMNIGQGLVLPTADGVRIVLVAAREDAPIEEARARPMIEAYLAGEQRRQSLEKEMASLRASTPVEYLGRFADMAASAPTASKAAAAGSSPALQTASALRLPAAAASAPRTGAVGIDAASLDNALSGLK